MTTLPDQPGNLPATQQPGPGPVIGPALPGMPARDDAKDVAETQAEVSKALTAPHAKDQADLRRRLIKGLHKCNAQTMKRITALVVYIQELAEHGNVKRACKTAGLNPGYVSRLRRVWPAFAELVEEAISRIGEDLVSEATRRARDGVKRPIYQKGELVGHEQVYSDSLMMFMLKGLFPERFADQGTKVNVDARQQQMIVTYVMDVPDPDPTKNPANRYKQGRRVVSASSAPRDDREGGDAQEDADC